MSRTRSPITTHVLDLVEGRAATKVPVLLEGLDTKGKWKQLGHSYTDGDGRVEDLLPEGSVAQAGTYQITFDTQMYFAKRGVDCFYPKVTVMFRLTETDRHHHIPLLLSTYGYSTYRGT
jgi:5-hydroxyisourate hydrolase